MVESQTNYKAKLIKVISHKHIDKQGFSEVFKLIKSEQKGFVLGDQKSTIFYSLDSNRNIIYLNDKARKWLNLDFQIVELYQDIDIDSYFEDKIAYVEYDDPDTEVKGSTMMYNLRKVWFPADLDFKLCLISIYIDSVSSNFYCSIVPIQDWKHLKNRLVSLIEEEEFIRVNKDRYNRLTKREKEVISLISIGLNSREISSRLFISKHTVEQHRKNAKKKLEVSTATDLLKFGRIFS